MSRAVHSARQWCLQQLLAPHWTSHSETWLLWRTLAVQNQDTAWNGIASLLLASTTVMRSVSTITTSCPSTASMPSCIRFGNYWLYSETFHKVLTTVSTECMLCTLGDDWCSICAYIHKYVHTYTHIKYICITKHCMDPNIVKARTGCGTSCEQYSTELIRYKIL
jgi:hypothetical protein